jgi:hypothetical protein
VPGKLGREQGRARVCQDDHPRRSTLLPLIGPFPVCHTVLQLYSRSSLDGRLKVAPNHRILEDTRPSKADDDQKGQRWEAIGYVQTDYLHPWAKFFNETDPSHPSPPLGKAYEIEGYVFSKEIAADLGHQLNALYRTTSMSSVDKQKLELCPDGGYHTVLSPRAPPAVFAARQLGG